jgi:hypothetical protein
MSKIIDLYLDRVLAVAELPKERAREVREELGDHLRSELEAQRAKGISEEEAAFAAIRKMGHPVQVGRRIARPFVWVDIRSRGTAKGVIAIGPRAIGVFAFGGIAAGVVAVGGLSFGLLSFGGVGFGLLVWAGMALGGISCGGLAVGVIALGGLSIGLIASGGSVYALSNIGKYATGAVFYPPDQVPVWLKALEPLMKIPQFILANLGWIMPLYFLVCGLCMAAQWFYTARQRRSAESWLFE